MAKHESIEEILKDATARVAKAYEGEIADLKARLAAIVAAVGGKPVRAVKAGKRTIAARVKRKGTPKHCRVPGCTNSASPRYDLFCTEHRDLPAAKKNKIKADAKKAA